MQTKMIKASTKEELSSLSLNRILLEITNFQGFEAENEITWNKLLNKIDFGTKKTKAHLHKDATAKEVNNERPGRMGKSFKDLLVNDNVVIIDKTPSQVRKRDSPSPRRCKSSSKKNNEEDKKPISSQEMPQPNVVQRVKDIFETLHLEPRANTVNSHTQQPNLRKSVNRSKSLCSTTNNYRDQYREIKARSTSDIIMGPKKEDAQVSNKEDECCRYRSEDEEKREWLNGCSPVSPEVIQKIREHGTSVTFFGRPAYSVRSSPIFMSDSYIQPYETNWPKPKIIETTFKYNACSSLCSSSVSSEDDGFDSMNHNASSDVFDDGFYYYSVLDDKEYGRSSPEDYYSYDIVYLSENYSRSCTPQLGIMNKGIWLRDPYWRGSSYIIYDFRGTDVKSHIAKKDGE